MVRARARRARGAHPARDVACGVRAAVMKPHLFALALLASTPVLVANADAEDAAASQPWHLRAGTEAGRDDSRRSHVTRGAGTSRAPALVTRTGAGAWPPPSPGRTASIGRASISCQAIS